MLDGRTVFTQIDERTQSARREAATIGARLDALVAQVAAASLERLRATRELAALRVQQLGAREFVEQLDSADRAALDHLEQRRRERALLDERLVNARAEVEKRLAERDTRLEARDGADEALDALELDVQARLRATAEYRAAEEATGVALEQAKNARAKAEAAAKDREVKRRPYESDRLFTYLWRRKFGLPSYTKGGVTRALDRWVARLVRYDDARRNYHLLLTLADRMDAHADAQEELAAAAAQDLAAREEAALVAAGAGALREALATRERELSVSEKTLDAAEARVLELERSLAAFVSGSDVHTTSAVDTVAERMRNETSAQLDSEAASTSGAQDDVLVARLVAARVAVERLEREVAALRETHANSMRVANELGELERRYRAQRYDSRESSFGTGLALGVLLDQLVQGLLSGSRAFDALGRHHSWRQRPHDGDFGAQLGRALTRTATRGSFGASFGSGIGASIGKSVAKSIGSSISGGGFRTGGRIGGGGFKTGGRF
jgi:hypothetical protein